jgi:heat shock protein HslJ
MYKIIGLGFLLAMLSMTACQSMTAENVDTTPSAELHNTLWKLTSLDGVAIKSAEGQRMASLTLTAEASQARIVTACNRGSAAYKLDGNSIKFEVAMSTKMMCEPEPMKQEAAFFKIIQDSTRYAVKGEILELYNAQNKLLATFRAEYLK